MNDAPTPTSLERAEKLQGMGCKRKRVEDVRFTKGAAITSTTSSCRACCTATSIARATPTPAS